jgi:hypothetical protein
MLTQMENMKSVIEKYVEIISELELANQSLCAENQTLRLKLEQLHEHLRCSESQLGAKSPSSPLKLELEREQMIRKNLENTIENLKEDISILVAGDYSSYARSRMSPKMRNGLQVEYETLKELYEDSKHELYLLSRENLELKTVVYGHSKLSQNRDREGQERGEKLAPGPISHKTKTK